jgi:CheY-like chemotaxis protein
LVSNHILIVDKVSSARVSLASSLVKLGALRKNMSLVGSFSEARDVIAAHQPKVIFSDYLIGNQSGFDFIQEQKLEYEQKKITDSICILITANASQSAAARAAEEDVDHFVIKPYTFNLLHKAIRESVQTKLSPNRYLTLISQGKHALAQGEIQRSLGSFSNAMNYDRKPTLALYYLAKLHEKNNDFAEAEKYFREGLEINKIHYKCLSGLHDLLWAQKKHQEAYKIVKKIVDYFPANSRRLSNVLRAAIITDSFQDMEGFYEIFLNIEERTDELIRYMCSALVITGKYYLNRDLKRKALDLFDAAAVSSAGRTKFLLYIVETLVQFKFPADADKYLKRMRALDSGSSDYLAAKFLVSAMVDPAIDAIHLGRQTVQAGALFPSVFEKLIELSLENGFGDSAEELIFQAKRLWPEKDFPVAAKV